MWLLSHIQELLIHVLTLAGVVVTFAGFLLGVIPFIKRYQLATQIIGILLLLAGIYLQGGLAVKKEKELEIADLKTKLAEAKADSAKVNTEVVTKYITKKQIIKEKGDTVIEYIDREVTVYDKTCPIPKEVIKAHNAAAMNNIDQLLTPSTVINTSEHNAAASLILPKK
jgi:predicted membrane protein